MYVERVVRLIETTDDPGRHDVPPRAALEELARQGQIDHLLLVLASQEFCRLYGRVMRWREAGQEGKPPLTSEEVRLLQARGNGASICEGVPTPDYLAETYRSFCLWYCRMLEPAY
jgi:hypothetical protein